MATARAKAYAPHADLIWMETAKPEVEQAAQFADAVHAAYPGKMLAHSRTRPLNLSPSPSLTLTVTPTMTLTLSRSLTLSRTRTETEIEP